MNAVTLLNGWRGKLLSAATLSTASSADPQERGSHRNRRAALSGITAATARVVQIGASLITVPLTIRYLGNERFGLWMTMSSILVMASFADFGLGNGLLNVVAKAYGKDDFNGVRRAVSSAFASLSTISIALLLVFFSIYRFVPWADFFRVTSAQARSEAGPTLAIFAVCFALNLPADVVQKTQMGLQQGFRTNAWQLVGSAMGLIAVITGIWLHVGLPTLILAAAGTPLIAVSLNALVFFGFSRPDLKPRWKFVSRETTKQILSIGMLFFTLQVVAAISFSADNFLIARTMGAVNVPEYAIPQRMFSMISVMITVLITPLWPAYGEAIARGDKVWVRRVLFRSMSTVFLVSASISSLLLLSSYHIIYWWVGASVHPPLFLLVGLCIWTIMDSCGSTLTMFLNGSGHIRVQNFIACVFGVSCITAKVYLVRRYGITAVPWATILTWGLLNFLPLLVYLRWKLREMEI